MSYSTPGYVGINNKWVAVKAGNRPGPGTFEAKRRQIRSLIERVRKRPIEEFGWVYENADQDTDGEYIHNLTITWKEPEAQE